MIAEENVNPEEIKADNIPQKDDTEADVNETEKSLATASETATKKISPVLWMTGAAAIIGVVVIVSFISALMKLKVNYQQEEAVKILELISSKIKSSSYFDVLKNLKDGTDARTFASSIGITPEGISGLKYHLLGDFKYHKGGGKPNNGAEFYVEAKSSLDEPVIDMFNEAPKSNDKIDKNLTVRLYSDGTIENSD